MALPLSLSGSGPFDWPATLSNADAYYSAAPPAFTVRPPPDDSRLRLTLPPWHNISDPFCQSQLWATFQLRSLITSLALCACVGQQGSVFQIFNKRDVAMCVPSDFKCAFIPRIPHSRRSPRGPLLTPSRLSLADPRVQGDILRHVLR